MYIEVDTIREKSGTFFAERVIKATYFLKCSHECYLVILTLSETKCENFLCRTYNYEIK